MRFDRFKGQLAILLLVRTTANEAMAAHSSRLCTGGPSLHQKQCPMCSFECLSVAILLSHLRLVHSSDPRFLVCCGIDSCTVTSRSFSSLYTHVFAIIEEPIVIGGDMVLFCVRNCNVRYFDDHYHAYVVDLTSQKSLKVELLDRNVYHAHVMSNGLSYITLKHSFMYIIQEMLL